MAVDAMLPILAGCMLVTGAANTLLTKYQDMQCVENCSSPDLADHKLFEQPIIQTLQMLMGEGGCCWLVIFAGWLFTRLSSRLTGVTATTPAQDISYQPVDTDEHDESQDEHDGRDVYDPSTIVAKPPGDALKADRQPLVGWSLLWLALPVCCDILGTTTMQIGLLFIAASIYQMVRGFLVIWVGLFSVIFLHRRLGAWKWISMVIVVAGIAVVGLAGIMDQQTTTPHLPGAPDPKSPSQQTSSDSSRRSAVHAQTEQATAASTLLGVILVAGAQVFTASQFVIEERLMEKYRIDPIKLVSWEGTFGIIITLIGMIVLHLTIGATPAGKGGYFDAITGFQQIFESKPLLISSVLTMISIAGFNFFGLSITKRYSAAARSTLDACRTLAIWMVSLGLGWESFKWLQVVGFVLVVYGTGVFNEIIREPTINFWNRRRVQT